MFIKEIIIDGFKSYATRTVVSGFDPHFNAITGLNGSGKSNILDSICFVLGISNLSQVRASNLRDLVYKQGQGQVQKASVSIIFDNSDKKQSPIGFEGYDEITVTREVVVAGKNKYMINGSAANQQRVQNLFHSVQLNVNNPHFLIMQGRITKVLNMKPPEILALIEEAAGTRMFEMKKQSALKTILKKQQKVDEINKVLSEEITPQLEKLRRECQLFMQWSSNNIEIERLERFCVAATFFDIETTLKSSLKESDELQSELKENDNIVIRCDSEIEAVERQIEQLTRAKMSSVKGEYLELEKRATSISKDVVKYTSTFENLDRMLETECAALFDLEKQEVEIQSQISEKGIVKKERSKHLESLSAQFAELQAKKSGLEGQQLGFNVGSNSTEKKGSLVQQQMDANTKVTILEANQESLKLKMEKTQAELIQKKNDLKHLEKEFAEGRKHFSGLETQLGSIDTKISNLNFDPSHYDQICQQILEKERLVYKLQDEVNQKRAQLVNVEFSYESRLSGARIYGRVVNLLQIKDEKYATALEVTAGSRLYNVVVNSEETGKDILENAKLSQRVNIIPLNRIEYLEISSQKIHLARELVGKENVVTAESCVDCDHEVEAAIKYAFGGNFICNSSNDAKEVAFHKRITTRAVTLDGDVFNPVGTLTGGSRAASTPIIQMITQLKKIEISLRDEKRILEKLKLSKDALLNERRTYQELVEQREMFAHKLMLAKATLEKTDYCTLEKEIADLDNFLHTLQTELGICQEDKRKAKELCFKLEQEVQELEGQRDNIHKKTEKELKEVKKHLEKLQNFLSSAQAESQKINLELENMCQELEILLEQKRELTLKVNELTEKKNNAEKVMNEWKEELDRVTSRLNCEKKKHLQADSEVAKLQKNLDLHHKNKTDAQLSIKRIAAKIQRFEKDRDAAKHKSDAMLKQYHWIQSERHLFGKTHTDYDFANRSPSQAQNLLVEKRAEQSKLDKKLNKKSVGMKQKAEEEYQNLMNRRQIIEKDKRKIEEVIEELDRKKNEALHRTWQKVNKDFGSIFATLLPGTSAKLEPPEGCDMLEGLEVRVAFGDVWKESLSELSGGQRSLLALSLILSLLLYKPAPMYILDEVDAALDLSHTQNIGRMLKAHFSQSQFIVVSLKDGMFNNANVLFRTKFVDGVSTVTRTVCAKHKSR